MLSFVAGSNPDGRAMIDSRAVLRRLTADGWEVVRTKGSHVHLRHPTKTGIVTVKHPAKDFPMGTVKSMERQSGVSLR